MNRLHWATLGMIAALAGGCETPFSIDGPPEFEVGTGEFEFRGVEDGEELQIIKGSQGGSHLWMGIWVDNMNPNDMHLDLEIEFAPEGEFEAEPYGSPLFFNVDLFETTDGAWEFAGLPAQVEPGKVGGRRLLLHVTGTDQDGRTANDSMQIIALRPE